ncbi:MAG: RES domain-containing protein [Bacteroidia bacterium]|nr:RES domain-containing protein [Bacteroidia bacterium]
MEVFRLCKSKFSGELSGKGAAIMGGRWNSPGIEIIYTSSNRSLTMAEVAVHFNAAMVPVDYMMVTILIPDSLSVKKIMLKELPENWNCFPPLSVIHHFGDKFVSEKKYCLLEVPSAVTQGDYNILINPNHPDYKKIKIKIIEKFPLDRRIFKG